jgi:hypothetical protein
LFVKQKTALDILSQNPEKSLNVLLDESKRQPASGLFDTDRTTSVSLLCNERSMKL